MNILLILISTVVVAFISYKTLFKVKEHDIGTATGGGLTLARITEKVRNEIAELIKSDTFEGVSESDHEAALSRKAKINVTLKEAVDGKDAAKDIILDLIYNIVDTSYRTEQDLEAAIPFRSEDLDPHIKFEILMYHYKKILELENLAKPEEERRDGVWKDAFKYWVKKYDLNREKFIIEDGKQGSYVITPEEVNETYALENIQLSEVDKMKIISIMVFQRYKGFGCIDTVRALDINGLNIGVSGSILTYLRKQEHTVTKSVWANFGGRYIHLRFLDFGSVEELRRVVQLLSRYNSPGPLTEKRGYIVNNMYDESRILAVRPPFAESYGAFIRKFGVDHKDLRFLIYKDYITDWELPHTLIEYLMKGQVTTAFTGRQGCGKTTMMTSAIEFMNPRHNLRIIEMAFEMNLREHYPERNIMTFQETEFLDAHHAQDAQKKSDGAISLFGEVATDPVAARMIQTGRVASLYTIFSHHAKTAADLVMSLADSIVAATGMADNMIAQKQVIDVVHMNIHLDYTVTGKFFIERITEIVKLPEGVEYPDLDPEDLEFSKAELDREYYARQTDRKTFEVKDIIRYDLKTDTYIGVNMPSDELLSDMFKCLEDKEQEDFNAFLLKFFGETYDPDKVKPTEHTTNDAVKSFGKNRESKGANNSFGNSFGNNRRTRAAFTEDIFSGNSGKSSMTISGGGV